MDAYKKPTPQFDSSFFDPQNLNNFGVGVGLE